MSLSNSVHEFEIVLLTCFISVHCATLITYLSEELFVRYKFSFMHPQQYERERNQADFYHPPKEQIKEVGVISR